MEWWRPGCLRFLDDNFSERDSLSMKEGANKRGSVRSFLLQNCTHKWDHHCGWFYVESCLIWDGQKGSGSADEGFDDILKYWQILDEDYCIPIFGFIRIFLFEYMCPKFYRIFNNLVSRQLYHKVVISYIAVLYQFGFLWNSLKNLKKNILGCFISQGLFIANVSGITVCVLSYTHSRNFSFMNSGN